VSLWQTLRREASGVIRSIRYDLLSRRAQTHRSRIWSGQRILLTAGVIAVMCIGGSLAVVGAMVWEPVGAPPPTPMSEPAARPTPSPSRTPPAPDLPPGAAGSRASDQVTPSPHANGSRPRDPLTQPPPVMPQVVPTWGITDIYPSFSMPPIPTQTPFMPVPPFPGAPPYPTALPFGSEVAPPAPSLPPLPSVPVPQPPSISVPEFPAWDGVDQPFPTD